MNDRETKMKNELSMLCSALLCAGCLAAAPAGAQGLGPVYESLNGLAQLEDASRAYDNARARSSGGGVLGARGSAGANRPLKAPSLNPSAEPQVSRGKFSRWGGGDWGRVSLEFAAAAVLAVALNLIFPHGLGLAAVLGIMGAALAVALVGMYRQYNGE